MDAPPILSADELLERIEHLGLNKLQAARRLGVHRSTVTRWTEGESPIPRWVERALNDVERELLAEQQPAPSD